MRIAEILMALALGALAFGFMWKAGERPEWTEEARFSNIGFGDNGAPKGGFWPFWVGAVMLLSCIWVFINGLLRLSPVSKTSEPYLDLHGVKILITVAVPVFLLVLLTEYISMYFAMALFLLYYTTILGRHGLVLSLGLSTVLPYWMFLFFDITMTKTLPKGELAIEDGIFVPLSNFFRKQDALGISLYFLAGGVVLVLASFISARLRGPQAPDGAGVGGN